MSIFKKVSPGDPLTIRADTFNSFIDAAQAHQGGGNNTLKENRPPLGNISGGIITARNISGSDQNQFAVLSLKNIVISPSDNPEEFQNRMSFDVNVFDESEDHPMAIALLQVPIKSNELGNAMILGISPSQIDVQDENHEYVKIISGDNKFTSDVGGVGRILYKESGTGLKWAVIHFPVSELQNQMFKVVSVETDYLICHSWDGSTEGSDPINIALPYLLRTTPFDGFTRKGITYSYFNASEREADNGDDTENQIIVPSYEISDIVYGTKGVLGGTEVEDDVGDPVEWLDINVDGRFWAKKSE